MTRPSTATAAKASTDEFRRELLGRLGLGPDANDQDVEGTHRDVVDFLDGAPESVKGWATAASAEVDEAFGLLSGPPAVLKAAAKYSGMPSAAAPSGPAAPVAAPTARSGGKLPWVLLGIVAAAALVFGVWAMGRDTGSLPDMTAASSSPSPSASAPAMDQAKLAGLMSKIQANPKDVASLQQIAQMYFDTQDYKNAAAFSQKTLAVDPKKEVAYILLGAAQFNQGDSKNAEATWLKGVALFPKNQELHYDLGFLYMSNQQTAKMDAEWKQVIAIDPTSELAKTVSSHMTQSTPAPSK